MSYVVGPEVITESLRQIAVSRLLLFETALAILIARWVRAALFGHTRQIQVLRQRRCFKPTLFRQCKDPIDINVEREIR